MKKILALVLALMMMASLAACGGDAKEEAVAPEAVAEEAPVAPSEDGTPPAPPEGEASGEPSGEAQSMELFDPAGYDRTWEGYKQYALDFLNQDDPSGDEMKLQTIQTVEDATEDSYNAAEFPWSMFIDMGTLLSYEDFLAS